MYTFLEVAFCILDFMYLHIYMNIFFNVKPHIRFSRVIVSIISFSIILHYCTNNILYRSSSNLLGIALMIIYTLIYFVGDIKSKVILSILFSIIEASMSALTINLVAGITLRDISQIMKFNTLQRIVIVILVKIIILLIIKIIKNFKEYLMLDIAYKYKYMLLGIFIFSFLAIAIITEFSLSSGNAQICLLAVLVICSYITFNMAILVLINQIGKYLQEENTMKIIINSQDILKKSIIEVDHKEKIIRKIKHDMLNHFGVLKYLISSKNVDGALEYINELQRSVEETSIYFKTGNIIADAVINQKIEEGKADNIKFNVRAMMPERVMITSTDLGALLSNLLDNAIEAVREVEGNRRIININIHPHNKKLLIEITNTVAYNPINEGKLIRRKKENYKEHGYGMKSIEYVVNKYNGYLKYKYENGEFNIVVLIDFM